MLGRGTQERLYGRPSSFGPGWEPFPSGSPWAVRGEADRS